MLYQNAQMLEEKMLVILFFRWSGAQKAEIYKIVKQYDYEYIKEEIYETVTKLRTNNMLSLRKSNSRYVLNTLSNQVNTSITEVHTRNTHKSTHQTI